MMATRISCSGGSIATVKPQENRDLSRSSIPGIAGDDELLVRLDQRVERIEELFLGPVLPGEELDVIDQQEIEGMIVALEFVE
jgi:hypothetical protein